MYLLVIFVRIGSAAWQNPEYSQNSLLRVSAPLREDLGWGETARSRLKLGSPRRGDPTIFIRVDLRDSRACSKTAEDCRCYNAPPLCPRASVRNPCFFYTTAASSFSWLRAFV